MNVWLSCSFSCLHNAAINLSNGFYLKTISHVVVDKTIVWVIFKFINVWTFIN